MRALAFWTTSTVLLAATAYLLSPNLIAVAAIVAAYNAWLLTRPRMVRVFRRLRGAPDWSDYFRN